MYLSRQERSLAFTYNDPVIFLEYAVDVARICQERGLKTVAVTAAYITVEPREEFFRHMDAANVDLKAFTEHFYRKICGGQLEPVLDTLKYLKNETNVWFELTNLLIPGENDSETEIEDMTQWIFQHLGPDVPLHFTAFHPDWKMMDWNLDTHDQQTVCHTCGCPVAGVFEEQPGFWGGRCQPVHITSV